MAKSALNVINDVDQVEGAKKGSGGKFSSTDFLEPIRLDFPFKILVAPF